MAGPSAPPRPGPRQQSPPSNGLGGPTKAKTEPPRPIGVSRGRITTGQKIGIYGPGGVGKTELCSLLEQVGITPVFADIEDSTKFLDVLRADPTPRTLEELRAFLRTVPDMHDIGAVVLDSATKAEELCLAWTIANVKHPDKEQKPIRSIEDYGFGKGYMFVFETFLQILSDLDAISRAGKHVVFTMHDCCASVPNPEGEDWLRYEPRLQSPPSGKGSIRHRVKEYLDHLFFCGFDNYVEEDGKAKGSGSRTIYTNERPTHWAKSRTLEGSIPYTRHDATLWRNLFNQE
jgi:hypothetical protein